MQEQFKRFLISEGYSEVTPSGNPSTVYDYIKRITRVIKSERLSWSSMPGHIDALVYEYDIGGAKEEIGNKSHRAVINALKAFQLFVKKSYATK